MYTYHRITSDHIPLCLMNGEEERKRKKVFRFYKIWLESKESKEVVKRTWSLPVGYLDAAGIIIKKLGRLSKTLKRWIWEYYTEEK